MNIPLEAWRKTIGYNPYHFWQQANNLVPVVSACNTLVYQYAWQGLDAAGRDDIQQAISEAHATMREYLNYRVGTAHVSKRVQYPLTTTDQWETWQANGRFKSVNVGEGYLKALGVPIFTPLEEETPITYSDSDGDGLNDTFTIVATIPAGLTYERLAVTFAEADWLDGWERSEAEVRPVNISITGATATITGASWLLIRPIRYEGVAKTQFNPNDTTLATNAFAQTLNVYALSTDGTGQQVDTAPVVLHYERNWRGWWGAYFACPDSVYIANATITGTGDTAVLNVPASGGIRDARRGAVSFAHWQQPDRVTIRYKAGAEFAELGEHNIHSGEWQKTVAILAAARLTNRVCACDTANRRLWDWQFDRARAAGANNEQYTISERDLSNPFGTRAGEIYAWNKVKHLALVRAFTI